MDHELPLDEVTWQPVSAMKVVGITHNDAVSLSELSKSNSLTPGGHERLQKLRTQHAESIHILCTSLLEATG